MGILELFGYASGLKINLAKSEVVGVNVNEEEMRSIGQNLGCAVGSWPLSYLGMPLGDNPRRIGFWGPVIEKIRKRLEGWVKGCLSRGGKLTLIQSVLESIPIYYLSLFKIPKSVAKTIEKMLRDFLWEGYESEKGMHLINWERVSKSKKMGGLGIGNIVKRNEALLGKWLWRFPLEQHSLWCSIIKSKYGIQGNGWDSNRVTNGSFRNPWKAISNGIEEYSKHTRYKVGNGERIRFWKDCWASELPLAILFPRLFRMVRNPNSTIASNIMWEDNQSFVWDIVLRRNVIESEEQEYINMLEMLGMWTPNREVGDFRLWTGEKSGFFSAKSYFELLTSTAEDRIFQPFNIIWKSKVPSKVKILAWLAAWKKLNTQEILQSRLPSIQISPGWCVMCKCSGETIDHLFIHCTFAHILWCRIRSELGIISAFPSSWKDLISTKWKINGCKKKTKAVWSCCSLAVLWCVWRERNSRTFEDKEKNVDEIWSRVKALTSLWAFSSKLFGCLSINDITRDWGAAVT